AEVLVLTFDRHVDGDTRIDALPFGGGRFGATDGCLFLILRSNRFERCIRRTRSVAQSIFANQLVERLVENHATFIALKETVVLEFRETLSDLLHSGLRIHSSTSIVAREAQLLLQPISIE